MAVKVQTVFMPRFLSRTAVAHRMICRVAAELADLAAKFCAAFLIFRWVIHVMGTDY